MDAVGFELEPTFFKNVIGWIGIKKFNPSLISKEFITKIPCQVSHFEKHGTGKHITYVPGPNITSWINNLVDCLKWNPENYRNISPTMYPLFKENRIPIYNQSNPFISIDKLKAVHKELHCLHCSAPKIKYRFTPEVLSHIKKNWKMREETLPILEDIFVNPKLSSYSNDQKWKYLSGLAFRTVNWRKLVIEIVRTVDLNLEKSVLINESESDFDEEEEEGIDIQKIIKMNQINSD